MLNAYTVVKIINKKSLSIIVYDHIFLIFNLLNLFAQCLHHIKMSNKKI
jgi:hypothetical protein